MRVLIADDHVLVRRGFRALLEECGHEIVGEAGDGRAAFELSRELAPDFVLMDLAMPVLDGLSATRLIGTELPGIRVLVLTSSEGESYLLEAMKAGASGYLRKDVDPEEFFDALERAARGEPVFTRATAPRVLGELDRSRVDGLPVEPLTRREREILELMARGITSDRELTDHLVVSVNTIKYHLKNILTKLQTHSRTQAVAYALRSGLVGAAPGVGKVADHVDVDSLASRREAPSLRRGPGADR